MDTLESLRAMGVGMLAPRMCELGHDPCGGSEVILKEDAQLLRSAGIPVRVYAHASCPGSQVTDLRIRTNQRLIRRLSTVDNFC